MIRRAKLQEIPEILFMAQACAEHMAARGIYQWNDSYPGREVFEGDFAREELFILEDAGQTIGCIVASTYQDLEYRSVAWLTPDTDNIYVHRLAVRPDLQGKGYARQLMGFVEDFARVEGAPSIRLDTFSRNIRNQKFYEKRGYQRLGDIYFPKQSTFPFYCYELVF